MVYNWFTIYSSGLVRFWSFWYLNPSERIGFDELTASGGSCSWLLAGWVSEHKIKNSEILPD